MDNNENLFYQQEYYFWSAISANTVKISNQTSAYFSELPLPIFNYIYLHQGALISDYEKAEALFKQQAKPYALVVHDQILSLFESEIITRRLVFDGESTSMILPQGALSQYNSPPPLNTDFQIIQSNDRLEDWAQPLITAFPVDSDTDESDSTVTDEYIRYHQRALDKQTNMVHLVLFADQQPVSTLTMTFNNETARLDDIGTDIQYQGKGLATSLIKHALYLCHQQGIKQCVLESSSEGLSIYKKLGFEPIFNYYSYISE
ncbi:MULTISPECIES: GNAT family N-acetyltransferase [Providencia]|uniref:GNAT family N-acetyltransferase n=1 Tax=Providencia TaxID=586 RepID=UPI002348F695|nr:GNAT family N-acetyltransferase [Providencia sp. PROV143]